MNKLLFILTSAAILLLSSCDSTEVEAKDKQIKQLEAQIETINRTNAGLLDRMEDLSIINKDGAESIKESLININEQSSFIQDLTQKVQSKDSLNLALVMNLKRSLTNINDEDISVEVRGGRVHVSISDKMLFTSGSTSLNNKAKNVLGKIASVINDHSDLEILVEGHTDNVPMNTSCVKDNWDLSVLRATTVVRSLQSDYLVEPSRLTAAGKSEYIPIADNTSSSDRSINRRTEIVIQPRMDQFFKLLESPELNN